MVEELLRTEAALKLGLGGSGGEDVSASIADVVDELGFSRITIVYTDIL